MKLTRKKKAIIASAAIRDIQILGTAILQYKSICAELKPLIRDDFNEDICKAIFNIFANSNLLNSKLNEIYKANKESAKYLTNMDGLTHLEEISTRTLEKMNEVIASYKV